MKGRQSKKLMRGIKGIYSECLLQFERNHVGFTLIVLTIVHGDLLVGPSTGECVGTHENYVSLIGTFEL